MGICSLEHSTRTQERCLLDHHVNSILQNWHGHKYDIYDAYAFAVIHTEIFLGKIATAHVNLGATPHGDKEVDYHDAILADSPDCIFSGTFYGGLADQDGNFTWKSPVKFTLQRVNEETGTLLEPSTIPLPPLTVPLEVGYTKGSRSLLHLRIERGLARWPYGSEWVTIFVGLEPLDDGSPF